LLSRVKNQFRTELQRLTTVTCLETVRREVQLAKGPMRPLDTIRLEVLTDGAKELFASPGDRKFSERHPLSFGGVGALGNGLFGLYLRGILLNDFVTSEYHGEEEVAGRRLARYDYRVPPIWSGQTIQTPEGSGQVGLHGSYLGGSANIRRDTAGAVRRHVTGECWRWRAAAATSGQHMRTRDAVAPTRD